MYAVAFTERVVRKNVLRTAQYLLGINYQKIEQNINDPRKFEIMTFRRVSVCIAPALKKKLHDYAVQTGSHGVEHCQQMNREIVSIKRECTI